MIKAILFDCFGVLVTSSYEPFKKKYFDGDHEKIAKFTEIEDRSSRGEITLNQALADFAELAGITVTQCANELEQNPENKELLEYIKTEIKPRFKVGLLSNVAKDRISELFTPDEIALFDDIVLSFQVGLAKPDPKIFELAAARLSVAPSECLFIDDLEKYLVGAEKAGMKTQRYMRLTDIKDKISGLHN
jgi:epoxide hydrolase-like predicted phosphatase